MSTTLKNDSGATPLTLRRNKWPLMVAVGALIVLAAAFAYCWQLALTTVAASPTTVGPPPTDLPAEIITLNSPSGATLAAWFISVDNARGTIVLAHPVRGSRLTMLDRTRLFRDAGYAVLLLDLQAHGESTGDTITMGHRERFDLRAAVDYAKSRNPALPIAVDGWSLGGAAALMASPLGIDALILEEVYPSIAEAVENRTRIRLGSLGPLAAAVLLTQIESRLGIPADDLRPIDKLANVGCPVLILAGSEDQHTTLAQSEEMFAAAREPKELVVFEGAPHVDLFAFDRERYKAATLEFLNQHMGGWRSSLGEPPVH
jgi:fermentation-respiration switch protein FrsA (DUF1100 family)